jgi:hypothetical protein
MIHMSLVDTETRMWEKLPRPRRVTISADEIDAKYSAKEERIVTETNREKLPNFVEAFKRPGEINVRPFYQRRRRWTAERQSLLIESFLMNIPVPPLFLYETEENTYEVMDGQQRINAILSFYNNDLKLCGLERWPELNGKTLSKLPPKIKAGIDRRSISYVVLLTESAETKEEALLLKQLVFERLNTGGVGLSKQEVRNCIYQGRFNNLLLELSRNPIFRRAWKLPEYTELEESNLDDSLVENPFYAKMLDVELVLRFFALRNAEHYQGGMQGFLDLYMVRAQAFSDEELAQLRGLFTKTLTVGNEIFGDLLFRPFDVAKDDWARNPQRAFYDSVMVSLSALLDQPEVLINRKDRVIEQTRELFVQHPNGTFTGRGNTKQDVQERIGLFQAMLMHVVEQ